MNITMNELRNIKHALPQGSISRIAKELSLDEQTIRNYFGANKVKEGHPADKHLQPGPMGGIVHLEDETILNMAKKILEEVTAQSN